MRLKNLTIIVLITCTIFESPACSDYDSTLNIPTLDTLIFCLSQQHAVDLNMEIDAFKKMKEYKWLHFLPGIGYDTRTHSPVVTISTTQYVNYLINNENKKLQIEQIRQRADGELKNKIYTLRASYIKLTKLIDEFALRRESLDIDTQLFEIEEQKYKNTEISTEEFLKLKRNYLQRKIDHQAFQTSINQALTEIEHIVKKELSLQVPLSINPLILK